MTKKVIAKYLYSLTKENYSIVNYLNFDQDELFVTVYLVSSYSWTWFGSEGSLGCHGPKGEGYCPLF